MAKRTRVRQAKQNGEGLPIKSVVVKKGKTEALTRRNYAAMVTSPELAAYRVIHIAEQESGVGQQIDVPSLMQQLREQAATVNRGDLMHTEAMLMNQATALQSLFARLAERGLTSGDASAFDSNMKMALRAQNQCRATLETLAMIKNPPVVYARQANIAHGNQQVNNGPGEAETQARDKNGNGCGSVQTPPSKLACGKIKNEQNELLREVLHGETVDTRGAEEASGADSTMATVGEIHRC